MTPKIVMSKVKDLTEQILEAQRVTGCYSPLPDINRRWLLRWKREKGVVLRRPNARLKCSWEKLLGRLRAMWVNVIKVRHLATRFLGSDLSDRMFGIDEKPLHMNEGLEEHRDSGLSRNASSVIETESRASPRACEFDDNGYFLCSYGFGGRRDAIGIAL